MIAMDKGMQMRIAMVVVVYVLLSAGCRDSNGQGRNRRISNG
jgi:hypothetical protein